MVKFCLYIFALTFTFGVHSQISFYKRLSGSANDYGKGVVQLPDSSYMVCGSSTSFSNGGQQAIFVKLDSMGNHIWSKNYGGLETESAQRIFHTPNEGFYAAGHTNTTTTGDFDFYFFHTDTNGDLLWEKSFGTSSWDILNDAIKLQDSSYILVGETFNPIDGEKDGYIVRLDKNGDTLWTKSSELLGEDVYYDIENLYDTAFVLAGKVWNADSSQFKSFLGCYKMDGTMIWENQYGPDGNYEIKSVVTHTNYLIGVGNRISPIDNLPDEYAVRVNLDGTLNYTFSYHTLGSKSYDFISRYGGPNDFYMAISNDDIYTSGPGQDMFVGDFNQVVYYENTGVAIAGNYDDFVGEIIPTSDSGAVVVGTNYSMVDQVPNVFVLKIGANQTYPVTDPATGDADILATSETVLSKNDVKIYPNPVDNQLHISISKLKGKGTFLLFDLTGKIVQEEGYSSDFTTMEVSSIESGIYILKLALESGQVATLGKITKN